MRNAAPRVEELALSAYPTPICRNQMSVAAPIIIKEIEENVWFTVSGVRYKDRFRENL